jgi:DNA processing protein
MPLCDDALAWMALSRAPALDAPTLSAALAHFESPRALLRASDGRLEAAGIAAAARDYLCSPTVAATARELRWLQGTRHHLVPFTDPKYPSLLRSSRACPIALYAAGNLDALSDPQLAVVGSRNPSPQGLDNGFEFARYLAERGLAITSGLAHGIDTAAHRGALAAQGVTLAVLGTGIDVVYPRSNRHLSEAIELAGALVSEFPLGTVPRRANFPPRNRLIAAMSLGTLVVEAARGSGSLITARWARNGGREVFAIPGSIHNPLSRGCHLLIKQGAKLTETPDDILAVLNFSAFFGRAAHAAGSAVSGELGTSGMDKEHKILLDALGFDPADLDTLVARTGFKPAAVSSMMLILELEGHVQAAPGGRYSRVANRRAGGER